MRRLAAVCLIAGSALCLTTGVAWAQSPDLIYHGGPVMTSGAAVTPIFWGKSWQANDEKIGWLETLYRGLSDSLYIGTNTEYTQAGGGSVSGTVSYNGSIIDNSRAPKDARKTSTILAEVCKLIANPVPNGYYPVYVDTRRGHAGYCFALGHGPCNGVTVQFGFFFNLDGDAGCDPQSTSTAYSQGAAALGNASAAALSATLTNPHGDGWYDANGAPNSGKCFFTFGRPLLTLSNGSQWKISGNYSNAAAATGSGYDHGGCIDGE